MTESVKGTNPLPPVERIRPGLWSIPVPLPNNSLRYVLVRAIAGPLADPPSADRNGRVELRKGQHNARRRNDLDT